MYLSLARAPLSRAAALVLCSFAFALSPVAAHAANHAPRIYGSPPTTAKVGTWYNFWAKASDSDGNTLRFSIQNKPSWLVFNTKTGRLSNGVTAANVGTYRNIIISVSDGRASASLPAFTLTVTGSGGGTGNDAPTISGTPSGSVGAGSAYAFTPSAHDDDGDNLTFSISNKPGWAAFSTSTGRLSGTPSSAQTGTYSNIVIKVSDGKASASLAAFSIVVSSTGSDGSATLSWTPPTQNSNGSTLTNLAGYRIYYGTSAGDMSRTIQIPNPGTARYVVDNLGAATWYFSVRAYNSAGSESVASNTATKTVR
jgi:hypothetical protein